MSNYNLNFISNENIFNHVKELVEKYRFEINLEDFSKNIVDPIKLTFDAKIYKRSIEELIESEVIRQIDKSNTNHIGYFHQNIFKYLGGESWIVPETGFDIENREKKIFIELKNKHNTMNSSSSQKTYMRMQNKILEDKENICFLVEVIAIQSQNISWKISLDGKQIFNERIRRVSIDKLYEIVTGEADAFKQLLEILPKVLDDVLSKINRIGIKSTVKKELETENKDILKSLYLKAFSTYNGFDNFNLEFHQKEQI